MAIEIGRIEIYEQETDLLQPKPQLDMAGVPPRNRIGISSGLFGNGGEIPPVFINAFSEEPSYEGPSLPSEAELVDHRLFWSFGGELQRELSDPTCEPLLLTELQRPFYQALFNEDFHKKVTWDERKSGWRFMEKARKRDLIKDPSVPFRLKQFVGSIIYR